MTVRLPAKLLEHVDIYREGLAQVGTPSRNDVLVSLIERGLRDALRPRRSGS